MKIILLLFISVLSKLYLPIHTIEKQLGSEQNNTLVAVSNYQNIAYTVQVSIGTPGQIFELLLDTASSDLWVVDDECLHCNKPLNVFYPSQSTTFSDKLNPIHISPQFSGAGALLGTDNVEIQELTVTSQTFALVVSDLSYQCLSWEGVLGLGFNNSYNNLILNLYNQGLIEQPLFSLYLNNDEDDYYLNSALVLGGVDEEFYEIGTFNYFSLSTNDQNLWLLDFKSVGIGGMPVTYGGQALFDVGTALILAPGNDYRTISEIFRINYGCIEGSQVICTCSNLGSYQNITIKFDDVLTYTVPPEAYFSQNSTTEMCVLLLGESPPSMPYWVLGTVFLRQYYTAFSMSTYYNAAQIGLAELKPSHHRKPHKGGSSSDNDNLLGLKIGLPIGGVIAIGAAATVVCCCILKRRKAKKAKANKDNQQKLIIYVGGEANAQRPPEVPSFIESVDEHYPEAKPIVVVNDPDKNTQTIFYPYLPPVADS
mmetsp:Transcript_18096/g.18082  ORF Transcript_18096/g.18082 Transcript_18096/m.18082 type:complete len:482 (+) Transcript_18096:20-1465(+)